MSAINRNGLSCSEAGKMGAEKSKEIIEKLKQERIKEYNLAPRICKECKNFLEYDKRKNKFCSKKCSAIFNNKSKRRKCAGCLNFAAPSPKKYCSRECYYASRKKQILKKVLNGEIHHSWTLRCHLIQLNGYKCSVCQNTEWMGKPIPIELDHTDGNSENNSLDNLRLICCNCHAQTPTYKSKNNGNGRAKRRQRYAEGKSY